MDKVWGFFHNATSNFPIVQVRSKVDGLMYNVRDMSDKQEAADLLARVRHKLQRLIDILRRRYPNKPQVIQLNEKFEADPRRFYEATPDSEHISYSVNKGDSIHLCLRQKDQDKEPLVNENVMVFVALHEMAHVASKSIGHNTEFWDNFAFLIEEAESFQLYTPIDYSKKNAEYCGMTITSSPYFT